MRKKFIPHPKTKKENPKTNKKIPTRGYLPSPRNPNQNAVINSDCCLTSEQCTSKKHRAVAGI